MKRLFDCSACSIVRLLVLATLASLVSGCMWSRARINDPEIVERAKEIKLCVTKARELPSILKAQPTRKRREGRLVTYEYSYSDAKTKTFSLLIVSFSRTEDTTETLYVETDAESGLVTRVPKLECHDPEWRWWPFGEEEK